MPNSNESDSRSDTALINKAELYGDFLEDIRQRRENTAWREKSAQMAVHKSLNMPMPTEGNGFQMWKDDSKSGLDWKGIAAIGAVGIASILALRGGNPLPPSNSVSVQQPAAPAQPHEDQDTDTTLDLNWRPE
jgi:hypothetical protein